MCIKRQVPVVATFGHGDLGVVARSPGALHHHHVLDGGAGAVSYTHLRAHETVLDLVCRLLLEKKKTNNPRHDYTQPTSITM